MKSLFHLCFVILIMSLGFESLASPDINRPSNQKSGFAFLVKLEGVIGPASQDFFSRALKQAISQQASVVILQLNTPGGLSQSMRKIIQGILTSPIPIITYVAPSGARAASAGTYILYASHLAVMAPGTHLGAATPVSIGRPSSPAKQQEKEEKSKQNSEHSQQSTTEKKVINDARAYIRSLAQLRKRNVEWAETAVTQAASLSASEALKLKVINFIAVDIGSLLTKANNRMVTVNHQSVRLSTKNLTVELITPDWRTKILSVITNPSFAYILLVIGFYGLLFELASPGFIFPGVLGGISLLLALYAFQLLPISYVGLSLILLGLIFIIAEIFITSFGILAIGGGIAFIIGSIMLMQTPVAAFHLPISLIAIVSLVTLMFFLLVSRFIIKAWHQPIVSGRESLIGASGIVHRDKAHLWVRIHGERWQCRSDYPLQEGDHIVVERIEGLICVVKPYIEREKK